MQIIHEGRTIYEGPLMALEDFPEAIPAAAEVRHSALELRTLARARIRQTAGDHLSLLGTTSDGAQLLLFHMAKLTAALAQVQSLEEVRGAASDFAPLAEDFLAEVAAGTVRLPFAVKGAEAVMAEVGARATAVADALDPPGD